MKSNQNTNKITALYCRLSKDDLLSGDSYIGGSSQTHL